VKSRTTRAFRKLLASLPNDVREQTRSAYQLFVENPHHPSLHFKQVHMTDPVFSARVGRSYRVVGILEEKDLIVARCSTRRHATTHSRRKARSRPPHGARESRRAVAGRLDLILMSGGQALSPVRTGRIACPPTALRRYLIVALSSFHLRTAASAAGRKRAKPSRASGVGAASAPSTASSSLESAESRNRRLSVRRGITNQ
jgi:mRNA-degrading endonuclease RelE of RelBE toxin-antitoxin system